jgi:hypothetical protein
MLPKDFRFVVALQPLSAGVPTYNESIGIEEEERVVDNCSNQ